MVSFSFRHDVIAIIPVVNDRCMVLIFGMEIVSWFLFFPAILLFVVCLIMFRHNPVFRPPSLVLRRRVCLRYGMTESIFQRRCVLLFLHPCRPRPPRIASVPDVTSQFVTNAGTSALVQRNGTALRLLIRTDRITISVVVYLHTMICTGGYFSCLGRSLFKIGP